MRDRSRRGQLPPAVERGSGGDDSDRGVAVPRGISQDEYRHAARPSAHGEHARSRFRAVAYFARVEAGGADARMRRVDVSSPEGDAAEDVRGPGAGVRDDFDRDPADSEEEHSLLADMAVEREANAEALTVEGDRCLRV